MPAALLFGLLAAAADPAPPRGYSIPQIDLTAETARQAVVDRDRVSPLGVPASVVLGDGKSLLAVYPRGAAAGPVQMRKSPDGGKTWGPRLQTPRAWLTVRDAPTLFRLTGPDDKSRLVLFVGPYPVRAATSEDDGATWTDLLPIGEFGGQSPINSVVPLGTQKGRYAAFFHDDGRNFSTNPKKRPPGPTAYMTVTADGGKTWAEPTPVATHKVAALSEPAAVRSPDGKRVAVILRNTVLRAANKVDEDLDTVNSFVAFSDDDGATWTEPRELPGALTGDRHAAAYAPDGRLVVTFRDSAAKSKTRGDWVAWVGTFDDLANGTEGQYRARLLTNFRGLAAGSVGLPVLADGTFAPTASGNWAVGPAAYLVTVRFTPAELDKLVPGKK